MYIVTRLKQEQQKSTSTSTAATKDEPLTHEIGKTYKLITNGKEEILKL